MIGLNRFERLIPSCNEFKPTVSVLCTKLPTMLQNGGGLSNIQAPRFKHGQHSQ